MGFPWEHGCCLDKILPLQQAHHGKVQQNVHALTWVIESHAESLKIAIAKMESEKKYSDKHITKSEVVLQEIFQSTNFTV